MGKILVFGEKYFNYTDSTAEALRKLGYEVKIVYMPVINKIKLGILNYLKYKINKEKFIKNFILSEQEILINIINDYKPNKFLSINGNFYYEYINKRILTIRIFFCIFSSLYNFVKSILLFHIFLIIYKKVAIFVCDF